MLPWSVARFMLLRGAETLAASGGMLCVKRCLIYTSACKAQERPLMNQWREIQQPARASNRSSMPSSDPAGNRRPLARKGPSSKSKERSPSSARTCAPWEASCANAQQLASALLFEFAQLGQTFEQRSATEDVANKLSATGFFVGQLRYGLRADSRRHHLNPVKPRRRPGPERSPNTCGPRLGAAGMAADDC